MFRTVYPARPPATTREVTDLNAGPVLEYSRGYYNPERRYARLKNSHYLGWKVPLALTEAICDECQRGLIGRQLIDRKNPPNEYDYGLCDDCYTQFWQGYYVFSNR